MPLWVCCTIIFIFVYATSSIPFRFVQRSVSLSFCTERKGGPQSFDYRRYSWIQPKPAITQQSLPTASTPHLHQLAERVIFYMLFWSNTDMLQRQQNAAEKPLMKENETLLMFDNVNQQIGQRSLTQRCHRSPAGPPQLEVRKHLRCTNDCKACARPSRTWTPHNRWGSSGEKEWTRSCYKADTQY